MLGVRLEVDVALNARFDARFARKQIKKAHAKVERMRDPVRGTARVVSSSDYRDSTTVAPSWTGCSPNRSKSLLSRGDSWSPPPPQP